MRKSAPVQPTPSPCRAIPTFGFSLAHRKSRFLPISAKTGDRIQTIVPEIQQIQERYKTEFPAAELRDILNSAQQRYPAGQIKGKPIRVSNLEQIDSSPPVFRVTVNEIEEFPTNYLRYLENQIRERYELDGVPLKFNLSLKRKQWAQH